MTLPLNAIVEGFENNVRGVRKLIDFDRELLEFAANQLRDLRSTIANPNFPGVGAKIARTEQIVRGVRDNDSLKSRFHVMFNQAIVLLVSYFGSAVEDLFKLGVTSALAQGGVAALLEAELKLTFGEIRHRGWNLEESAADLLVEKKDLSFQDMQAIARAFREFLAVEVPRDKNVNNIILAQACRHVIVHAGGVANSRLVRQVRSATPRDLKYEFAIGQTVQFLPHELEIVTGSMIEYVTQVAGLLNKG